MKILFVGPTLTERVREGRIDGYPGIVCRPPAAQGDIARAVAQGANVIGLIDGRYEDVAAPWHKEILHALSNGVVVFGGGSLGALRAAECAAYGMIGVGQVFHRYVSGDLVDDSDVAQLHAPEEFGSFPITEAFVNVEATIHQALARREIKASEATGLLVLARRIFFKDLTFDVLSEKFCDDEDSAALLLAALLRNRTDVKKRDALELLARVFAQPDIRTSSPRDWAFARSVFWRDFENLGGSAHSCRS